MTAATGVARGAGQVIVARGAFYALAYFSILMLARELGPADYGVYGLIISVVGWIEQVAQSTLAPAAAKRIPEGDDDGRVAGTTFALSCSLFAVLFLATWAAAPVLTRALGLPGSAFLLRVGALDLLVFGAYVAARGICQGHGKFLPVALAECVYAGTKVAGLAALVVIGFSVVSALVVNVAATVGGLLLLAPWIVRFARRWDSAAARGLLPLATRFGLYMLALQTLSGLELWMLTALGGSAGGTGLGLYVAARAAAVVPALVLVGVSEVLLPSLSKALADRDDDRAHRYLERSVRFLCLLMAPITALLFLSGDEVMALLFSEAYVDGGQYVGLLAAASGLFAIVAVLGAALNASGRSSAAIRILLAVGPVALGLNAVLVPAYGPTGAAVAQALTGLTAVAGLGSAAYRRFGGFVRLRTLVVVSVATVAMATAAAPISASGPLLLAYYAGALSLYGCLLVVLGELRPDDLAAVRDGLGLPALPRNP